MTQILYFGDTPEFVDLVAYDVQVHGDPLRKFNAKVMKCRLASYGFSLEVNGADRRRQKFYKQSCLCSLFPIDI